MAAGQGFMLFDGEKIEVYKEKSLALFMFQAPPADIIS